MNQAEISRLSSNLVVVEQNIHAFSQIISDTSIPGTESAQDAQLLTSLDKTCREMQSRLTRLLSELDPETAGETLFMDALRINDDLNNIFLRYERFCRSRPQGPPQPTQPTSNYQSPSQSASYSAPEPAGEPATGILIDLGDSEGQNLQAQNTNVTTPTEAEYWLNAENNDSSNRGNSEFDQFLSKSTR